MIEQIISISLLMSLITNGALLFVVLKMSLRLENVVKISASKSYNDYVIAKANEQSIEDDKREKEQVIPGLEGTMKLKIDSDEFKKVNVQDLSEIHNYITA